MVKSNLLQAINHAHPLIRSHLATIMTIVSGHEFPAQWPTLLSSIAAQLHQPTDVQLAYNGVVALNALIENYEYQNTAQQKELMDQCLRATLPAVAALFERVVLLNEAAAGDVQLVLCKTFSRATYGGVVPYLLDDAVMMPWAERFVRLITRELSEEMQPKSIEARLAFSWWKAKKVACSVWQRLFTRVAAECGDAYLKHFERTYASKLLAAFMQLLDQYRRGHFLTNKVLTLGLRFINQGVRTAHTFKLLKPHISI